MDKYKNFKDLSENENEKKDYKIYLRNNGTDLVIIGIHGGQIEPGTEEIVRKIAGDDLSFYIFSGNKETQHITSTNFDEKTCLDLVTKSKKAVSIHGKRGLDEFVMLGGLDNNLVKKTDYKLSSVGFSVVPPDDNVSGSQKNNICNKGSSGEGLQVEISRGLRNVLMKDEAKMKLFSQGVRKSIL